MSNWRKHKKSTFQIKYLCQKLEQGKFVNYSMFDAWVPLKDAEAEIKRLKKQIRTCNPESKGDSGD
jgi:hypothetical protein